MHVCMYIIKNKTILMIFYELKLDDVLDAIFDHMIYYIEYNKIINHIRCDNEILN